MNTLRHLFALGMAAIALTACNNGNSPAMAGNIDTDSIGICISDSMGTYQVSADFTTVPAIAEWMSELLGGTYDGNYLDGNDMLEYYVRQKKNDMLADNETDIDEEFFEENHISYSYDGSIKKAHETDLFVTFTAQEDIYSGGAHGLYLVKGQTFRKADGRRITWDILRDQYTDEFQGILKDGLKEYFEADSDEKLQECFLNPDHIFLVPLPQQPPLFMEDGIHFVYQQYEIAAYAFGLPSFVVSYDRIRPFLNITGQRLIE